MVPWFRANLGENQTNFRFIGLYVFFNGFTPIPGLLFAVAETEEHWHLSRSDSWSSGSMLGSGWQKWSLTENAASKMNINQPKVKKLIAEQMWMSLKLWWLGFCGSGWHPNMPMGIVHNFTCPHGDLFKAWHYKWGSWCVLQNLFYDFLGFFFLNSYKIKALMSPWVIWEHKA